MFPADGNPKREAIPLVNRPGTRINRAQANVQNPADIANSERAADQPGGDGAKDSGHPLATLPIKTNAACANGFNTVGSHTASKSWLPTTDRPVRLPGAAVQQEETWASPSHQLDGQNRHP
jgi:hypothetical protein